MELGQLATTLETIAAAAEIAAARAELQPALDERQIAALRTAASALTNGTPAKSRGTAAGTRWDDAEDERLCVEFDNGTPLADIAAAHSRSKTAITLRLVKLGRIDASTVRLRDRSAPLV